MRAKAFFYVCGGLLCLALIVSSTIVGSACAYTGGPQLIDVIGWDAKAERVYLRSAPQDESGEFGGVYFFDLRAQRPTLRRRVSWSQPGAVYNDAEQDARVRALRSRLRRLRPELAETLPSWVVHVDSTTVREGPWAGTRRFRIRVTFARGQSFECTTYHLADMCAKGVYNLPGRKEV